ncbi:MAG: hypothetical protein WBA74_15605, partial [Cyclobacteriaceae bacterium]
YIEGSLTSYEKVTFEMLLEDSPKFRTEVKTMATVISLLKQSDRKRKKEAVREFCSMHEKRKHLRIIRQKRWSGLILLSIVASLLLILYKGPTVDTMDIYHKYYEPIPVTYLSLRGKAEITPGGAEMYHAGKYDESISAFLSMEDTLYRPFSELYLSNAYMELSRFEEAETRLRKILAIHSDYMILRYARWYLSLSLLAQTKSDDALRHLKVLSGSGGYYQEEAGEIIRLLCSDSGC